jgi:hypothetical protein
MALLGLVAGPVLLAGGTAALLGVIEPDSAQNLAAAPEFVWELSLGIYLMVKGFRPSPITAGMTAGTATPSAAREIRQRLATARGRAPPGPAPLDSWMWRTFILCG